MRCQKNLQPLVPLVKVPLYGTCVSRPYNAFIFPSCFKTLIIIGSGNDGSNNYCCLMWMLQRWSLYMELFNTSCTNLCFLMKMYSCQSPPSRCMGLTCLCFLTCCHFPDSILIWRVHRNEYKAYFKSKNTFPIMLSHLFFNFTFCCQTFRPFCPGSLECHQQLNGQNYRWCIMFTSRFLFSRPPV